MNDLGMSRPNQRGQAVTACLCFGDMHANQPKRINSSALADRDEIEHLVPVDCKAARGPSRTIRFVLAVVLVLLCFAVPVRAQQPTAGLFTPDIWPQRYVLGNWGGERSRLAERGVTFDFNYIADLLANPTGGKKQTDAGWGRFRGTIDVDLGQLVGANGLTFHATGVWQFGTNLGAKIGTLSNPSGLVSEHAVRLDSWWLQQALFHNKVFVKIGQFAGQDFYGDQEHGSSYVMEPLDYAMGNLFGTTYESFDPAATPAIEVRFVPTANFYVKSAVLSGNRDPYVQDLTGFHFKIANAPVFVYEAGYLVDPAGGNSDTGAKTYPGIYKFGAAYSGGRFPDAITNKYSRGNYLLYGMVDQAVYRSSAGSDRGIDVDFALDWSPADVNRQNMQLTAGLRYNGPIRRREQDGLALGFVYSDISNRFDTAEILMGLPPLGSEKAIEVNYALRLSPCLLLQPVFQYYIDVGANADTPNAAVLGFRTKVTF